MKKIRKKIKKWMLVGVSGAIALAMGSVAFAGKLVINIDRAFYAKLPFLKEPAHNHPPCHGSSDLLRLAGQCEGTPKYVAPLRYLEEAGFSGSPFKCAGPFAGDDI